MAGDSASLFSSRSLNVGMTRNVFVGLAVVMAVMLLLWIRSEQDHITKCHEAAAQRNAVMPPISVHVQQETLNISHPASTENRKWNYNWDHRAWSNPNDAVGIPTRTVILVRHGQYDLTTGILNDRGRQQANITGARLKQLDMKYSRIVHSDQPRAKETATIVHSHLVHLAMDEDPLLAEGGPIPPEPTVNYWSLPDRSYFVDGPRLEAAFRKYFYRADRSQQAESLDILVGHANIFRYFVLRALQLPKDAWMRVFISHASISLLHINPDGTVTMTKFGDSGHMPPELITF